MERHQPYEKLISVCVNVREDGSCCSERGSVAIVESLKEFVKKNGLKSRVRVARSGCLGLCDIGPNVAVYPDGGTNGTWYRGVQQADVTQIIERHVSPMLASKPSKSQP